MKTKIVLMRAGITVAIILVGYYTQAQQTQIATPLNITGQVPVKETSTEFTYKVFQAPNKMYGYDIFKNNKFIFHQPAFVTTHDNSIATLSKKDQVDKAALFAIEKIKKGQPAGLSQEEIRKIISE